VLAVLFLVFNEGYLATDDGGFNPLFTSSLVRNTFQTGKDLQDEAHYGASPGGGGPGDLAVAKDGLGWTEPERGGTSDADPTQQRSGATARRRPEDPSGVPAAQTRLLETGLAVSDPRVGPDWIGTAPKLGLIYNATLADAIAHHNALSPVTDDPAMHRAVGALDCLTDILFNNRVGLPAGRRQSRVSACQE
jgi:hypothetical protein